MEEREDGCCGLGLDVRFLYALRCSASEGVGSERDHDGSDYVASGDCHSGRSESGGGGFGD